MAVGAAILSVVAGLPTAGGDLFRDEVAPILERRCLGCHNDDDRKGDYSLQHAAAAFADHVVAPGDADASFLVEMITPEKGKAAMPKQAAPLSTDEIATIRAWIDDGAIWPDGLELRPASLGDFDWWSYRPLLPTPIPAVDSSWPRTPIDAFVLVARQAKGLTPAPEADRRTLIRRLSYDLTGLPPTPEAVDTFVADPAPDAYERLVDRLLASKHYGERWAQHWFDVVKYADTCGYDKDKLRPNAWPYRDYVIRSLNEDKPYARFVQEQVAGDVLFPGEPDGILGLGFLAAGPWDFLGHVEVPESKIDGKVARNLDRDDMVSNTLNTFCSVTVQCARCHHHKFDPITQEHYYGLQAVFAAVDRAERPYEGNAARRPVEFGWHSEIAATPDVEKWVEVELDEAVDATTIVLRPCHDDYAGIGAGFGFPVRYRVEVAAHDGVWVTVADETAEDAARPGLAPIEIAVGRRVGRVRVTATKLAERSGDFIFALAELEVRDGGGTNVARGATVASLDSIEASVRWGRANLTDGRWPQDGDGRMVYAAATHFPTSGHFKPTEGVLRPIHVLHRGDVQQPRDVVSPGALPLGDDTPWRFDDERTEGERRAALARWLTDERNPFLWRSIVNRVWQHHFGEGIVATPNDFGRMGATPTHPALLDWLACEFRDGGGSLKDLHRLIVTSSVYRQSSRHDAANAAIDSGNASLWRMPRRRLDAEEIRDSILAVSGALDLAMGGPGYYLFELERTEHSPHYEYHKFDPSDPASHRRSVYRFIVRSQPDPWMTTLDCADSSQSTPKRNESLTSLQALSLLNNRFNLVMSERFAARLEDEAETLPARVDLAMRLVTQRPPTDAERDDLVGYAERHGLANLCRMLFNLSEFVYVD